VSLTSSDYVVILGADNRLRSDFVERCRVALDGSPDAAVAYTDVALFGPSSHLLACEVGAAPTAARDVYLWRFPEPTPERLANLPEENIIHGSSMFRRADYDRVGGYRSTDRPEDHDLFVRMLGNGRTAVHVAEPVLEYRQHSAQQANTVLTSQIEAEYHRREAERRSERIEDLERVVSGLRARVRQAEHRAIEAEVARGVAEEGLEETLRMRRLRVLQALLLPLDAIRDHAHPMRRKGTRRQRRERKNRR
jgi:hypothetical protein